MTLKEKAQKIKLLICDVDGVLTDGKIYIGNEGELFKAFDVKDGLGIKMLLANGIDVAILTARSSEILKCRTRELGITNVLQGQRDKVIGLGELLRRSGLNAEEVAYIGDDVNCYELLCSVGMKACPADACNMVKSIDNIKVMLKNWGEGCLREFVEMINLSRL